MNIHYHERDHCRCQCRQPTRAEKIESYMRELRMLADMRETLGIRLGLAYQRGDEDIVEEAYQRMGYEPSPKAKTKERKNG